MCTYFLGEISGSHGDYEGDRLSYGFLRSVEIDRRFKDAQCDRRDYGGSKHL